jgi:hypothetical protein
VDNLSLLPQPRSINFTSGQHLLKTGRFMLLHAAEPSQLLFSAKTLQSALEQCCDLSYPISASVTGPAEDMGIVLRLIDDPTIPEQGYKLAVTPERIILEAPQPAGIFYAVGTLIQLIKQIGPTLPGLEISDWPDFPVRGYMLDISRDKVPTLATLRGLIDKLASWKINQVQLYTEHTFAYLNHPEVWKEASPLTGQDILELDSYCKERFIELVPNQNSFGHMHRWLIHPRYAELAEVTEGFMTPWGYRKGPFSLDPTNPASFELVKGLFDELLPHFSSRTVNIGCDETFDLGQGKSKPVCDELGKDRVYLDFLKKISGNLIERGYKVQFWGDIVLEHPEAIPQIPKGVIALDWGYDEDYPFEVTCSKFEAAGVPFYVCPGTSAWCSLAGRSTNAINNLRHAAEAGLKHGAEGYLITDWGDLGHWQTLPVSYLGIVVGAALSWSLETNQDLDVPTALNRHAFEDQAGVMGKLAYELGNIYLLPGLARRNASQLFWILQYSPEQLKQAQHGLAQVESAILGAAPPAVPDPTLIEALNSIDRILAPLENSRMTSPEAELVKREYRLTANMLRLACWRGLEATESGQFEAEYNSQKPAMLQEYKEIWLSRNQPGGLADSMEKLLKL